MDRCQTSVLHTEKVKLAQKKIPSADIIQDISEIFKAMGDPTRLKIVMSLAVCELCVCDLSAVCQLSESAISHQLRILRNLRIVNNRREGKVVYYRLNDAHVKNLVDQSLDHVLEQTPELVTGPGI